LEQFLPTVVVWTAAAFAVLALHRSGDVIERRWLGAALIFQILMISASFYVVFFVYRAGDPLGYLARSVEIRAAVQAHPDRHLFDLVRMILQQSSPLDEYLWARGGSTKTLTGLVTVLRFGLADSAYAIATLLGFASFFGRVAMYRGFRLALPEIDPKYVFGACMLVPSVVFWSGGIVKESLAVCGLGLLVYGLAHSVERGDVRRGVAFLIPGAVLVFLLKAYFLVPFAVASGVWVATHRGSLRGRHGAQFRPERLVLAGMLTMVVVAGLGVVFPSYALPNLVDEVSERQERGVARAGDSTFLDEAQTSGNAASVARWAPFAVLTALTRPFLFEARSPVLLVSAAEMSVFLVLALRLLFVTGPARIVSRLLGSPALAFCAVMTFGAALGIGLSTVNLGTMARYRAPMLPFYALLLLGVGAPAMRTYVRRRRAAPLAAVSDNTASAGISPR
jgi:hypothetical protein